MSTLFDVVIDITQYYKRYYRCVYELTLLSETELSDLGLSRYEIPLVAAKALNN